jgi:hypothetical protein
MENDNKKTPETPGDTVRESCAASSGEGAAASEYGQEVAGRSSEDVDDSYQDVDPGPSEIAGGSATFPKTAGPLPNPSPSG